VEVGASDLGGALVRIVLPTQPAQGKAAVARIEERPKAVVEEAMRAIAIAANAAEPAHAAASETAPHRSRGARAPTVREAAVKIAEHAGAPVLWIDDDALFLRSIKRVLKPWDVRTARTAAEAQAMIFDGSALPVPMRIFCDVGLPDRGGHELHQEIAQRAPEVASRFVFVTGGAISADVADYLVASKCPTLLKPIRVDEVEKLLAEADVAVPSILSAHAKDPEEEPPISDSPPTVRPRRGSEKPPSSASTRAMQRKMTPTGKPTTKLKRAQASQPPPPKSEPPRKAQTVPSLPQAKRKE